MTDEAGSIDPHVERALEDDREITPLMIDDTNHVPSGADTTPFGDDRKFSAGHRVTLADLHREVIREPLAACRDAQRRQRLPRRDLPQLRLPVVVAQ